MIEGLGGLADDLNGLLFLAFAFAFGLLHAQERIVFLWFFIFGAEEAEPFGFLLNLKVMSYLENVQEEGRKCSQAWMLGVRHLPRPPSVIPRWKHGFRRYRSDFRHHPSCSCGELNSFR